MKLLKSFTFLFVLGVMIVFAGCDDLFEARDTTLISPDVVKQNGHAAAVFVMQASFNRLVQALDDISYSCEIATDNADETDSFISSGDIDMGDFFDYHVEFNTIYSGLHDARNQADLFLTEYLPKFDLTVQTPTLPSGVTIDRRRQTMVAFATLVRGWSNLYLGSVFKEVNYNKGPRTAPVEALNRALSDLQAVEAMYASGSPAPEQLWNAIDIRKVANTLRARTLLQLGRHTDAITAAASGLRHGDPAAQRDVRGAFYAEQSHALYTAGFANSAQAQKRMSMSNWFISRNGTDMRAILDSTTGAGAATSKFGSNNRETEHNVNLGFVRPRVLRKMHGNPLSAVNFRLISWQENYLVEAEAQLYKSTPDISAAITLINQIRSGLRDAQNNLIPTRTASTLAAARTDLEHELRMEMCAEQGYYFTYLRRLNRPHYWKPATRYEFPIPNQE